LKTKGKNYAKTEDFLDLKNQLSDTTELVESIKSSLTEKSWINQQIWLKQQEAYEEILSHLYHVKKFVNHQVSDYENYEYIHNFHPYHQADSNLRDALQTEWERDFQEYERRKKYNEEHKAHQKLESNSDQAFIQIIDLITVKSIYVDCSVGEVIHKLKCAMMSRSNEEDEYIYYRRINENMKSAMNDIFKISKEELGI